MVMKEYFTIPGTPGLEPYYHIQFIVILRTLTYRIYLSAVMQMAYSTASTDWADWYMRREENPLIGITFRSTQIQSGSTW